MLSLLLVLLPSKFDDDEEIDNCLATCSKIDVIVGAFSSKRGDIKGEHDELCSAEFFITGHSVILGEVKEARRAAEPQLLTGKICFGGLDLHFRCLRKVGSSSDSKRGRQLLSLIVRTAPSGGGDSSTL